MTIVFLILPEASNSHGCLSTRKANHRLSIQVIWTYLDAAANATARAAVASSNFFLFFSSINCFSTKLRASCSAFSFFSNWLIFCLSFCFTCTALCNLNGNDYHTEFYNYNTHYEPWKYMVPLCHFKAKVKKEVWTATINVNSQNAQIEHTVIII